MSSWLTCWLLVQENYGRSKETHAHTQALWEKEIRRARKETFKSQSVIVKLQEELKSARSSLKTTEETLEREKERSLSREHEAFQARYELVGCQEQVDQAMERVKIVEQERDAFKSLARSEEDVAKIASEGMLPLPKADGPADEGDEDEFASPRKATRISSLSLVDIKTSAASESEMDDLTRLWQWERQRADRASEQVAYLEIECYLRVLSVVCGMTRLNDPVTHFSGKHGWAGWVHWEDSGAHLYAWEDPLLFFSVDIYTCAKFDNIKVAEFTSAFFAAEEVVAKSF